MRIHIPVQEIKANIEPKKIFMVWVMDEEGWYVVDDLMTLNQAMHRYTEEISDGISPKDIMICMHCYGSKEF